LTVAKNAVKAFVCCSETDCPGVIDFDLLAIAELKHPPGGIHDRHGRAGKVRFDLPGHQLPVELCQIHKLPFGGIEYGPEGKPAFCIFAFLVQALTILKSGPATEQVAVCQTLSLLSGSYRPVK